MRPGAMATLIIAVLVGLGLAGWASAETEVFGLKIDGEVELGGRVFLDDPSKGGRAKLEEYRDLSEQPFGAFRLRLLRPDQSYGVELGGEKIGQEDQSFSLSSGRTGLWNFGFEWDQIPHLLSTNARSLAIESAKGVFTLPSPRPSLGTYNRAPEIDELSTRWDIARFQFTLTPSPDLDLKAEYSRIHKNGERPFGAAFGSPGGNFLEIARSIDETIHDFRLSGSYSGDGWQVQAGYILSVFQNDVGSVTLDNPCFRLSAPVAAGGCAGDSAGSERGRVSLAPDNSAHTLTLAGGVNLPMRTRVTANFSYSLRLQDDQFLPHTVNPAVPSSPLLKLPRESLDGEVHTLLFNVNATSRPIPPLTLTLRYRIFDLDDQTPEVDFPGHIVNDRPPVVNETRVAGRWEYTKQNADLDARWRFGAPVALTLGGGWERWDRNEHREVPQSDEYFGKLALDVTPVDWATARLTYVPSFRRVSAYNPTAHQEHAVIEEDPSDLAAQGQSPLLRKFDEGARDRHRVDLMVDLSPTDVITVSPMVSYRYDDYVDSRLGLQKAETWSAGLDVGWAPAERVSVSAGYVYESIDQRIRSSSREFVNNANTNFPDFDWVSKNVDTVHTIHAGFRAMLIPNRLNWLLNLSYSAANGENKTSNPLTPRSGTAAQRTNATAKPYPDTEERLFRLETELRYQFSKAWSASLGYVFEKFENKNWQTDGLTPFSTATGSSIFLGSDLTDYTAHYIVMSVGYRF